MDKGVIEGIVAGSQRGVPPVITPSAADLGTSSNCPTISFPSKPRREIPPTGKIEDRALRPIGRCGAAISIRGSAPSEAGGAVRRRAQVGSGRRNYKAETPYPATGAIDHALVQTGRRSSPRGEFR